MSDVFVSYKAEDKRRVRPLVEALEADGYSVWWDEQIGGGATWRHAIETELNSAKCVLVAWSKRSVAPEGTFVQDEATRAQQRHVYVPVLIDKVHLPLGFGETQALPLVGWKGNRSDPRYQAVLTAVRRIAGEGAGDVVQTRIEGGVDRRLVLGSGVAVVAAAGFGGWALLKPGEATAANSIAVLPFANLSGDPAQAYFSDGIAEELRSALARLAGLKVVGRTSSEAVRNEDAETASRKLGVPNVLTGSVRQSPATIRVSAQLIDGKNGIERWSQSYDSAPGDAIQIQTEIAENVARALSIALGSAGRAALTVGGTQNATAQDLLLQARELMRNFSQGSFRRAIGMLDAAIALDPNYAQAYALKAIAQLVLANRHSRSGAELARSRAEALRNAQKAVEIAPKLPVGHGALAEIYRSTLQLSAAYRQHKRVMQLASGDPDELASYALFLAAMGRADEALRVADRAVALDRLNPWPYATRAQVLFVNRRFADVVQSAEKLKAQSPNLYDFPISLGDSLVMLGRYDEARRVYAEDDVDDPIRLASEGILAARTGDRASALARKTRLEQLYGEAASYQYAQIHANLGETDQAFAALDRALQIKDPGLVGMKVDPFLDPIRKDRRFGATMRRVGFPA